MKNYDFQDPPHAEPHTFLGTLIVTAVIFGIGGVVAVIITLIGGDGIQFNKGSALIALGTFVFIYLVVLTQHLLARRLGKKKSEKLIVRSFLTVVMVALVALAIWTNLK
ncbi:hypothetical protein [Pelagicoccus mobilis]|uniref:Uncharacterized protein n=1 Tax=Pelagicoccus mobilis TaxID=415221 RepID=A0A934S3P9_9BACT|nr:hypothetical protein [Pelagicoccus mobilis]MBK1880620.1 hypothetical protein [Pelagicoccus mobilis]